MVLSSTRQATPARFRLTAIIAVDRCVGDILVGDGAS